MIETIKFKPEYEKELLRLGVKTRFLRNRIEYCNNWSYDITEINECESFYEFVGCAFKFDCTPEGYEFWEQVSNNIKPEKL